MSAISSGSFGEGIGNGEVSDGKDGEATSDEKNLSEMFRCRDRLIGSYFARSAKSLGLIAWRLKSMKIKVYDHSLSPNRWSS